MADEKITTETTETAETAETTETDKESLIEQIGEMPLREGVKSAWKYILRIKFKYIALCIVACVCLILTGLFAYYVAPSILKLLWHILKTSVTMPIGLHDSSYSYELFDIDLFSTIPVCLSVAAIVAHNCYKMKWLCGLMYFMSLISVLEVWDYWFVELNNANEYLGGICFILMFIVVPILFIIRNSFSKSEQDAESKNIQTQSE